jgi:thiol-disulfide isomerase/thioredoxin
VIAYLLLLGLAGQVDGAQVRHLVAAQRGRPVVLTFWATWCAPCVKEFPDMVELARSRKDVAVISVSLDDASSADDVAAFVEKQQPSFPVYLKAPGRDESFINEVDPHWSGALPATLVFDAQGHKTRLLEGEQTRVELERAIAETQSRAKKAPTRPSPAESPIKH